MQNRQINTTEEEIRMVIGLAADEIAEGKDEKLEDAIMSIAARIAGRAIAHLTGERRFSNENIMAYEFISTLTKKYSGGKTDSPSSVEEDKVDENS